MKNLNFLTKNTGTTTFAIILIGLIGYYGYLIFDALKTNPAATNLPPEPSLALDEKALADIRNKNVNGNLPILLNQDELNNPAPFVGR